MQHQPLEVGAEKQIASGTNHDTMLQIEPQRIVCQQASQVVFILKLSKHTCLHIHTECVVGNQRIVIENTSHNEGVC